ncbi:hypothetical protein PIB30_082064 [Stylosanthes scabra]|uniref:Uncharacterized protein n=1 Tax=Stylosanthes scabra TaxID=79078 RepID=A0ABU6RRR6_9FABA|nr:hypothetical protein [Stylosanthes scabra]
MRKQIRDWTRNASSREGYCCWAHQQANPILFEIPPHKIPDFLHDNVANKKDPYYGALKSDIQQGESSQVMHEHHYRYIFLIQVEKWIKEAFGSRNRVLEQKSQV